MNKQPWLIDGEALKEWLNSEESQNKKVGRGQFEAAANQTKYIRNVIQSGHFNVKEENK